MDDLRIVLLVQADAPNRQAKLTVSRTEAYDARHRYMAIWEPGYCGCRDCHPIHGFGATPEEAIGDYWEQWEEKHG
jgi:hypothetical protein